MSDNEYPIEDEPQSLPTGGEAYSIDEELHNLPPGLENVSLEKTLIENMRLRKRMQDLIAQKRAESRSAMRGLLLRLLDVADALDRIILVTPDPASQTETRQWNNIRLTRKVLDKAFQLQQVTPIDLLGKESDPALCEVEDAEERPDLPDGTVIQELIKGYRWGDEPEPLRLAVVIVSSNAQTKKVEAQ
jgi:molecular chaperone GrpE (heat shock protein)